MLIHKLKQYTKQLKIISKKFKYFRKVKRKKFEGFNMKFQFFMNDQLISVTKFYLE